MGAGNPDNFPLLDLSVHTSVFPLKKFKEQNGSGEMF
jgi:hypothetical protein